jgi:hypothetical protein
MRDRLQAEDLVDREVMPGVRPDEVSPELRRVLEAENLIVDFEPDEITKIKCATAVVRVLERRQDVGEVADQDGDVSRPLVGWIQRFPERAAWHIQRRVHRFCPVLRLWVEERAYAFGRPHHRHVSVFA